MSILIQESGILTTIQDLGRNGYCRLGINPSGVMDRTAARLINILLGNDESEPVLEMHFPAPQIIFEASTIFAVGGGDLDPQLDGRSIENWRPHFAKKGSTLKFSGKVSGNRAYLVVKSGLKTDKWLGSSSTNLAAKMGGFDGRKIEAGDRINLKQGSKKPIPFKAGKVSNSLIPLYSRFPTIRIIAGAEFENLTKKGRDVLLREDFLITANSNRMGFRLSGEPIFLAKPREFISSAVSFGTIQILPNGQLIVLMADHQTAGGYPRIANVISRDLPLLAQLGANDKVAFHLVETKEAEDLAIAYERELNFFRIGCRFQANSF